MNRLQHFISGLIESHYTFIALVLNVALVILGAWLFARLHSPEWHWSDIILPACVVVAVGLVDILIKKVYDRYKARHVSQKLIEEFVDAAALSLLTLVNPPLRHIRVNII